MSILNSNEERLDQEERIQQQMERLQSTLNRAYRNVPFYRNHFKQKGVEPSQIASLEDLRLIPFTGREHLSENYPYGLFAVPLRDIVRIHTARGTAVKPAVSGYTRQDLIIWRDLVARALTAAAVSATDILQIVLDPGLANWGRDYKDGAEAIGAGVIPMTVLSPEKQLMVLRDYRTTVLVTSASGAAQLIHHLFRANLNPNSLSLKTLVLVGEAPDQELHSQIEDQLHVKAWVHYGLSEVPGPALAFECEERCGLHVSEDHFLPEVVDPENGQVLEEGKEGELVLTTLTTRAYPLIRFRTGDRVRMVPGECACGRTLRRIEWIPARTDGMMVIRGVKVDREQVLLHLERSLGFMPVCHHFRVGREEMRDYLEVWLKVDDRVFSDEVKEMERLCLTVGSELGQDLGLPVRVRLKEKYTFESGA